MLEFVATWRRARVCANGSACFEVAARNGAVAVRDSTNPDGPHLWMTDQAWIQLTNTIKKRDRDAR